MRGLRDGGYLRYQNVLVIRCGIRCFANRVVLLALTEVS